MISSKLSELENVTAAESFFIDALEEWRQKVGINSKFTLLGHSLGGYLSTVYTEKYPTLVKRVYKLK